MALSGGGKQYGVRPGKNRTICDASSPFVPSSVISFSFILLSSCCSIRKQTKKGQSAFEREQWAACAPPLLMLVGPAVCWSSRKAAPCWSASAEPLCKVPAPKWPVAVCIHSTPPGQPSWRVEVGSGPAVMGLGSCSPGTELCKGLQWRKGKEET